VLPAEGAGEADRLGDVHVKDLDRAVAEAGRAAAQSVGDLDDGAVAVGRQLLPERHGPPVDLDGLLDAVQGTDGRNRAVSEPAGHPHSPRGGGELAGPRDPHHDPGGEPENGVLAEPDRFGPRPGRA
jgi:hypothetical protein